jgi:hypothetical protein
MQKHLTALLSCSLLFLLGANGCCNKSCKKAAAPTHAAKPAAAKKATPKTKKSGEKHTKVAALYNQAGEMEDGINDLSAEEFSKLTYLDERSISDFDVAQATYDNNPLNIFSAADQQTLDQEISTLVSLWKAQDAADEDLKADFQTLFLDADTKSIAMPSDLPTENPVAHADIIVPEEPKIALIDDLPEDDATVKVAAMIKQTINESDITKSLPTEDSTTSNQLIA